MLKKNFDQENEHLFLNSRQFMNPSYIRGIFIMFIFLYGLFFLLDLFYFNDIIKLLFMIRFAIVIPVLMLTVLLTYTKYFYKFNQHMIALSFFVGGSGIAYMLILDPDNIIYHGGLFIVLFSGYLLIKLRFIYASYAGSLVILFYVIGHLIAYQEISSTVVFGLVFLVCGNIVGMVGNYNIEKANRQQFLDTIRITGVNQLLKQQYDEKNEKLTLLEESIRENKLLQSINIEKDKLAESLKKSEEQYRLLSTEMQLGLALHEIICDESGKAINYRFINVNESFERLVKIKKEDILGKTVLEVFPNTEKYWIDTYGKVALNGESIRYENYSTELGRYFNVSAYSPKKRQFAVIVEDITERVFIENQRKKEQRDLLTSQKIAKLGTWRLNIKTNEVVWSEELYKMYGFDSTLPPPPYTEHMKLFTKNSWIKLSSALSLTSSKGIPYEFELETINKDGTNGWMWVRGEAEFDDQGKIISINGAAQDITERKRLEQELNESNQINVAILDKSPVAIEFFDVDGNHTYLNDSAIALFGVVNPNELKSLNLFKNPNLSQELLSMIKQSENIQMEIEYDFEKVKEKNQYQTTRSGKIILELSITPLLTNNQLHGYIVHSKDVTEQKTRDNEIIYISNHDFLTNIPNRRYFSENLDKLNSKEHYPLGIVILDINGLKLINDTFGYKDGDMAIQCVADVIQDHVQNADLIARLGGDEFGIIIPKTTQNNITQLQELISEKISKITIHDVNISVSTGHALKNDEAQSIDEIIKIAEQNMYKSKVLQGRSMRSAAILTILATLTNRHNVEKVHSEKVSEYCYEMGKALNLSKEFVTELKLAGLLHDIGKISIPDKILSKPDKLDDDEWDIMKKHTIYGYNILRAADEYSNLALYALTHHEKYDGTGYPKGLAKDEIPLFSRIICVVDAYEAMTGDRPYRKAPGREFAIEELIKNKNIQFDPNIVDVFLKNVVGYER